MLEAQSLPSKRGKDCNHRTGSVLEWPRSPERLPSAHWTLWKQALTSCFLHRDRQLSQSLGHWIKQSPQRWKWFFSHSEDQLYAKEGWLWRVYPRSLSRTSGRRGGSRYLRSELLIREPPLDVQLATIRQQGQSFYCSSSCKSFEKKQVRPSRPPASTRPTFQQARQRLPAADRWAIDQIYLPNNGEGLANSLINGTAIAVSGGSFKDSRGTSGYVLEDQETPTDSSRANHPRRQAMRQTLQMEVQEVYEEGSDTLLSRDRLLFSKPLDTLQSGNEIEMRQWLSSVLLARQRAVSQTEEYIASLHAERNAM
jgi:hypothetical protein